MFKSHWLSQCRKMWNLSSTFEPTLGINWWFDCGLSSMSLLCVFYSLLFLLIVIWKAKEAPQQNLTAKFNQDSLTPSPISYLSLYEQQNMFCLVKIVRLIISKLREENISEQRCFIILLFSTSFISLKTIDSTYLSKITDCLSWFPRTGAAQRWNKSAEASRAFGSALTTRPMGANWVEKQP